MILSILISLLMCIPGGQNTRDSIGEIKKVYIRDHPSKIVTNVTISFLIIEKNENVYQETFFIHSSYSKKIITNVSRAKDISGGKPKKIKLYYIKKGHDNVVAIDEKKKILYYDEISYFNKKKYIPDDILEIISPNFLKLSNLDRLMLLRKMSVPNE